ncbi:MAG: replicative DNA helicase [Planctomycetes bacterium]|nr:replicative DNA helicase [Planctomycetota bacterium]
MTHHPKGELPHNLDAEKAVLGALLLDGERMCDALDVLSESDFYERRHRVLFAGLRHLDSTGRAIDYLTVGAELEARGQFEAIGGNEYLLELSSYVTTAGHLSEHMQIVSSAARLRGCARAADDLRTEAAAARPTSADVDRVLDLGMGRLSALGHDSRDGGPIHVENGLTAVIDELCNPWEARRREYSTGLRELDELLGGFNRGDLLVAAARPSMGKTALALNIADHVALPADSDRRPTVLIFSLEMRREQVMSRLVCARADVPARWEGGGLRPEHEIQALREAGSALAGAKFWIDDDAAISMQTMRNRARRLRQRAGLDLIIVDYLQLVRPPSDSESRQVEISQISGGLKSMARELDVPVIAVSQLSRKTEARNPPRPMMADLRESGAIEQDADVVLLLYRESYYEHLRNAENDGKAEVIVAKHRNGPTGSALVRFDATRARFRSSTVIETVHVEHEDLR